MKSRTFRILLLFVALILLAFQPLQVARAASPAQVEIPPDARDALVLALTAFFAFWFTEGVKSLSTLIALGAKYWPPLAKLDISGWGSALTAFAVSVAMYYVDKGLGVLPPLFAPIAPLLVQALIALLAMGMHTILKQFRPAPPIVEV